MPSTKRQTSSTRFRLTSALFVASLLLTVSTHAAVVIGPGSSDPRGSFKAKDPQETSRVYSPLRAGDPLDFAHWHKHNTESSNPGEESVVVQHPLWRPALYAGSDDIDSDEQVPSRWHNELALRRDTIARVVRSVGRIEVFNLQTAGARSHLGSVKGTAFVVAPGILMTNRHVANSFLNIKTGAFKPNHETDEPAEAWINFAGIRRDKQLNDRFRITGLIYATQSDEEPDVALLKFDDQNGKAPPPLPIQIENPAQNLSGRQGIVCGYPAGEYTFFRLPALKRIAPGFMKNILPLGESHRPVIHHDSSTAGGNSGSPLVDLQTGLVVGLHFQGQSEDDGATINAAEPIWALLKIEQIRNAIGTKEPEPSVASSAEKPIAVRRPALVVDYSGQTVPPLDTALGSEFTAPFATHSLAEAAKAVALVTAKQGDSPLGLGTAFVVAPRLLLIPSFVVTGSTQLSATFQRTYDRNGAAPFSLRIVFRSERPATVGIVLATTDDEVDFPEPIDIIQPGRAEPVSAVAVLGHHSFDARMSDSAGITIFSGPNLVKRLSPGLSRPANTAAMNGADLAHDASTSPGSSGSPIFDLYTGRAVGVHIGGSPLQNFGIRFPTLLQSYPELKNFIENWRPSPTPTN